MACYGILCCMVITGTRAIGDHLGVSREKVRRLIEREQLPVIVTAGHGCFMTTTAALDDWERNQPKPLSQIKKDSAPPDKSPLTR
jgi:hypothetical protein